MHFQMRILQSLRIHLLITRLSMRTVDSVLFMISSQILMQLYYSLLMRLRSIGIRALDLVPACAPHQLDLFEDAEHRARQRQLDITLDNLRARYGKTCVLRGRACFDPALGLVQREEHAFLRK